VTAPVAPHRSTAAPSERVRVRRAHKKAAYDPDTIAAILDEALVAHLGFAHEGQPFVIPTLHARIGDRVLVHGSSASRTLRALGGGGLPACLTVTLIDGLVYARSIFEMSTNYRSVVVLGEATPVTDFDEKMEVLHAFSEQVMPGRWDAVRRPTRQEVKATAILSLPLSEASAKVSSGGPDDGASPDAALPVWAGHVPVRMVAGDPVPCPHLPPGIPVPDELVRAALRP
jgi:nitroimidazol reductase NimA-like FMN-containing flavoprotein (pyridoxamine 5'-phosphate oxidase superfamily)